MAAGVPLSPISRLSRLSRLKIKIFPRVFELSVLRISPERPLFDRVSKDRHFESGPEMDSMVSKNRTGGTGIERVVYRELFTGRDSSSMQEVNGRRYPLFLCFFSKVIASCQEMRTYAFGSSCRANLNPAHRLALPDLAFHGPVGREATALPSFAEGFDSDWVLWGGFIHRTFVLNGHK
jgi:hypothetical protein